MLSIAGRAVGTIGRIPRQKKSFFKPRDLNTVRDKTIYTHTLSVFTSRSRTFTILFFRNSLLHDWTVNFLYFVRSLFIRYEYVDVCIFLFFFFFCENTKIGRSIYDLRQFQNNSDTCAYAHFLYVTKCECVNLNKNIFIESYIKEGKIHFHPRKRFS